MAQCVYGNNELDNHIVVTGRVKYIEAFSMDAGIKNDLAVTCGQALHVDLCEEVFAVETQF